MNVIPETRPAHDYLCFLGVFIADSRTQQSVVSPVLPLGHIIMIPWLAPKKQITMQ